MTKRIQYKDGQYISYMEYGNPDGFPMLVQHGMIASIKNDTLFTNHFKETARIICVARPGYGNSSPIEMQSFKDWGEIVQYIIKELMLTECDIFSASAGATYGYAIAHVCPEIVRNIYVFSGMPAYYDPEVQSNWPYPIEKNMPQEVAEKITYEIFFANAPKEMLENIDIKDSMNNNCYGPAQDLKIRFEDWGVDLSGIKAKVYMQHSKQDEVIPYKTAERTAFLLPDCSFRLLEKGSHFTPEAYQLFIEEVIIPNIKK